MQSWLDWFKDSRLPLKGETEIIGQFIRAAQWLLGLNTLMSGAH